MTADDDLKARLRDVERQTSEHGAGLAAVQATVIGISRTVDTFAPIVQDVHEIKTTARAAKEQADATDRRLDDVEAQHRADRARKVATLLTVVTVVIALLGLLFVVLQFSGLGHG